MFEWIENRRVRQALLIVATTCIIIITAFGLIESTLAGQVNIEVMLLFVLIAPAVCLPALAFRNHAQQKEQSDAIIETQNRHLNAVLDNMTQGVSMFDAEQRLIICNERFTSIYRMPPAVLGQVS